MAESLSAAPAAGRALRELGWDEAPTAPGRLRDVVSAAGTWVLPPVNTALFSPRGFDPAAERAGVGRASASRSRSAAEEGGTDQGAAVRTVLGADLVRGLRSFTCVTVDERSWPAPYAAALAVVCLCCAGVPVLTRGLSEMVRSMIDLEVLRAGDQVTEQAVQQPDVLEALSIVLRRQAHRAYGFHIPDDEQFARVSVVLAADDAGADENAPLVDQIRAQSWPNVRVHEVEVGADRAEIADDVARAGSVYVTRMIPEVSYGPHHLEGLVQALRHSGAPWVQSPSRFEFAPQDALVLEQPGIASERASAEMPGLVGTALWYAADGPSAPPTGTPYLGHGCDAILAQPLGHGGAPVSIVHRRRPAQLAWFRPSPQQPGDAGHRSYFALAGSATRS